MNYISSRCLCIPRAGREGSLIPVPVKATRLCVVGANHDKPTLEPFPNINIPLRARLHVGAGGTPVGSPARSSLRPLGLQLLRRTHLPPAAPRQPVLDNVRGQVAGRQRRGVHVDQHRRRLLPVAEAAHGAGQPLRPLVAPGCASSLHIHGPLRPGGYRVRF